MIRPAYILFTFSCLAFSATKIASNPADLDAAIAVARPGELSAEGGAAGRRRSAC